MRITRNNYEEFFLLYVDNELSAADRQAVERFVTENPDLQEEWDLFLQCKVHPDHHLAFTGRESLFKQEKDPAADSSAGIPIGTGNIDIRPIDTRNYEEYFLSYIDGELDEDTSSSVEEFARRHPALLAELASLQQTVSTPDPAIVFENKELLYKKEAERRILFFPWRIAAAALVAGVIGLLILNPFKKDSVENTTPGIASTASPLSPASPDSPADATASDSNAPDPNAVALAKQSPVNQISPATPAIQLPTAKKNALAVTLQPSPTLHHTVAGEQTSSHSSPANRKEEESKAVAQIDAPVNAKVVNEDPVRLATTNPDAPTAKAIVITTPVGNHPNTPVANADFATQALLSASAGSDDDGTMESSPAKKNKLRGLFRKVTRVLEKNTSRDEDDKRNVLIGSFQFALK